MEMNRGRAHGTAPGLVRRIAVALTITVVGLGPAACGAGAPAKGGAGNPPATPGNAAARSAVPGVEGGSAAAGNSDGGTDPILGLDLGTSDVLVAWKVDHPGFLEANGWDTTTWRARLGVDGRIVSIEEAELRDGAEKTMRSYSIVSEPEGLAIRHATSGGEPAGFRRLARAPDSSLVLTGGDGPTLYRRGASGALDKEWSLGKTKVTERWDPAGTGSSTIRWDGKPNSSGGFGSAGSSPFYVERRAEDSEGMDELGWTASPGTGKCYSIAAAEPIALFRALGLERAIAGRALLENLAIIEAVLGLDRRMTPLLARLSFEAAARGE